MSPIKKGGKKRKKYRVASPESVSIYLTVNNYKSHLCILIYFLRSPTVSWNFILSIYVWSPASDFTRSVVISRGVNGLDLSALSNLDAMKTDSSLKTINTNCSIRNFSTQSTNTESLLCRNNLQAKASNCFCSCLFVFLKLKELYQKLFGCLDWLQKIIHLFPKLSFEKKKKKKKKKTQEKTKKTKNKNKNTRKNKKKQTNKKKNKHVHYCSLILTCKP